MTRRTLLHRAAAFLGLAPAAVVVAPPAEEWRRYRRERSYYHPGDDRTEVTRKDGSVVELTGEAKRHADRKVCDRWKHDRQMQALREIRDELQALARGQRFG